MAFQFPSLDVADVIRGAKLTRKAGCVAASAPNANWTTAASAAYSTPTLTLTGLSTGTTIGTIDGFTGLATGDRILLKDMAAISAGAAKSDSYNGIWEITGGTTTSITCVRAYDLDEGDATRGVSTWVIQGVSGNTTGWASTTNTTVASGTNNFTFTQFDTVATLAAARGGTGVTTFGGTNTILYTTSANTLSSLPTAANSILATNGSGVPSIASTLPAAVIGAIDHSALSNLTADSHTQYALLAGRAGGQSLIGGTAAGNNLVLQSTSNASRGVVQLNDPLRVNVHDAVSASTMSIGPSVATKVEIAQNGVITEVRGALQAPSVDRAAAGTLAVGGINATVVDLGRTSVPVRVLGPLQAQAGSGNGLDTQSAGTLPIGAATATKVEIAQSGVITEARGPLQAPSLDRASAGILTIGATNATSVELGAAGVLTRVVGDLLVSGTATSVNSEVVNVADNHLYLNSGYTTASAQTGGLVVNYLPIATSTTVAAGGFTAATTVATVGAATFAAGQIVQISGATNQNNNGIFQVVSHASNVLTISATPSEDWLQNAFTVSAGANGTITRLNVSVMRANSSGDWQVAKGATVPLTYSALAVATTRRTFQVISAQVNVNGTSYTNIGNFPWLSSLYNPVTTSTLIAYIDTGPDRGTDLQIFDGTSQIGIITVAAATAANTFSATFTAPVANARLQIRCRKSATGGTNPIIYGVNMELLS